MSIAPITTPSPLLPLDRTQPNPIAETKESFSDFISSSINQVNQQQIEGDKAIEKLHSGEARNLHDVMISVEQADISLRMLVQVRNKALTAYEEIMRMQI